MDINKLDSVKGSNNINKSNNASGSSSSENASSANKGNSTEDKISLSDFTFRNNDKLFAKLELEKLNNASSKNFNKIKSQVSEYKKAVANSSEDTSNTTLGKKLNDPSIWDDIAEKILK